MAATQVLDTLPLELKVYFVVVHAVLFLIIAALVYNRRKIKAEESHETRSARKAKTVALENKEITIESCEWVNSSLTWLYLNSNNTPRILDLWIDSLNDELRESQERGERIFIEGFVPGGLPPQVPSVYCLRVDGKMQCITFHIEAQEFGFIVSVEKHKKHSTFLISVLKLKGELTLQAEKTDTGQINLTARFIGDPEIMLRSRGKNSCVENLLTRKVPDGENGVSSAAVEEKVKEVITKTVTTVPIPADEKSSPTSKDDISGIPQCVTCLGEEGKLLVKVLKASELSSRDGDVKEPYCVISCTEPCQKKRTTKKAEAHSPCWNEYFVLNINKETKEVIFDIYDHQKSRDSDFHFDDKDDMPETDDFLGQVVVSLAAVNRDQTCRLIYPVLPKSQKSDYAKGHLTVEFTFDKDGKVIDGLIPLTLPCRTRVVEEVITTKTETIVESRPDGTHTETETTTTETVIINGKELDEGEESDSVEHDNGLLETELVALEASVNDHDRDSDDEDKKVEEALANPMDNVEMAMELEILEAMVQQQDIEEDPSRKNHKVEKEKEPEIVREPTPEKVVPVAIAEEESQEEEKEEEIPPTVVVPLAESPSKERVREEEEKEEEKHEEEAHEEAKEEPEHAAESSKKSKKGKKVFAFKKHKKHDEPHDEEEKKEEGEKPEGEEAHVEPSPKPKKPKKTWSFRAKKNKEHEAGEEEKEAAEGAATEEKLEDVKEEGHEEAEKPKKGKKSGKGKKGKHADEEDGGKAEEDKEDGAEEGTEEKPKKGKKLKGGRSNKGKHPAEKEGEEVKVEEEAKEEEPKEEGEKAEEEKKEEPEAEAAEKKGKKHWGVRSKKGRKDKTASVLVEEPEEHVEEHEHKEEEVKEPEEAEKKEEEQPKEEEKKEEEPEQKKEGEETPKSEKSKKVKKSWTFHGKKHKKDEEGEPAGVVTNGDANEEENKENQDELRKTRSFRLRNKQRPVSMIETSQSPSVSKDSSKRHSYHEGDKSGSKDRLSFLSYSPSTNSSLIIETPDHKHYYIPKALEKRGAYERKGNKLHVFNDHVFEAVHFSGDIPSCAACSLTLGGTLGRLGKQGYQCRDCKMTVHKGCHCQVEGMCPSTSVKKMEMGYFSSV